MIPGMGTCSSPSSSSSEKREESPVKEKGEEMLEHYRHVCVLSDPEREMFFCRPRELSSMGRREEEAG